MKDDQILGMDLGGTHARTGKIADGKIMEMVSDRIPATGSAGEVLEVLYHQVDRVIGPAVRAIGIGVPSVVDVGRGIVYDVRNIPSWKEVPLKDLLYDRYRVPVFVNNDANCFALGEKYFGKGKGAPSLIGLIIGTGLGAGIVVHNKLYPGINCGAGEFGEIDYLGHNYEYYASGGFFRNVYGREGAEIFQKAEQNDPEARAIFEEFGIHLGNAIKMMLYAYDPGLIIIGGSVSKAFRFFERPMWDRIRTFSYPGSLERLKIGVSDMEHGGVLGAAALYFDEAGSG